MFEDKYLTPAYAPGVLGYELFSGQRSISCVYVTAASIVNYPTYSFNSMYRLCMLGL